MIIPMLNPVVYSLRNKEVKNAFTKILFEVKYCLYNVVLCPKTVKKTREGWD
jgi:hypothetical protein